MNRYQHIIGQTQYYVFLLVVALLPFPQIFLRYACGAWIALWLLEGRWLNKSNFQSSGPQNLLRIPFLLFGAWFVWKALSGLWAEDTGSWVSQMERYVAFGLVIPMGLWGLNRFYDWRKAGRVLVISCVSAIPIYILLITVLYHHREYMDTLQWQGWNNNLEDWFTFFSENITVLKHRLHLCAVELFGAITAYRLYAHRPVLRFGFIAVLLSVIPLSASRQSILTAAALIVIAALYALPKRHRIWYGTGILVIGAALGFGLLKMHPRMQQFDMSNITKLKEVHYTHDIRFNIWGAGLQHPHDYLWTGLGAGQSWQYMKERYTELDMPYYAGREFNCHNQYLEETIELGIFGLMLFLLAWISIVRCAPDSTRQTAWMFTMLFVMNMFTESVFGHFDGVVLWAAGMMFLLLEERTRRLESDTEREQ